MFRLAGGQSIEAHWKENELLGGQEKPLRGCLRPLLRFRPLVSEAALRHTWFGPVQCCDSAAGVCGASGASEQHLAGPTRGLKQVCITMNLQ